MIDLDQLESDIDLVIRELATVPGMVDQASFRMGKSSKKEITRLEEAVGCSLPESLREFYVKVGTYTLDWKYRDPANPNRRVFGISTLFGPREMLKHPDPAVDLTRKPRYEGLLWNKNEPNEVVQRLQELFILDELRYDNYVLIEFPVDGDVALWLYSRPHRLAKLALSFENYLRLSLKSRGMYLWQQYCLEESDEQPYLPDDFHSNMALLFPETDLADFLYETDRPRDTRHGLRRAPRPIGTA